MRKMLKHLLKAIVPAALRSVLRERYQVLSVKLDRFGAYVGRKSRASLRRFRPSDPKDGMTFGMLCIRRTVYVDLAIDSINSLHYHNSSHRVLLHVDPICLDAFNRAKSRLDYPHNVQAVLIEDNPEQPWPWTKIDLVLDMAKKGIPFVDADSRWHCDPAPLLLGGEPMFLVVVNRFEENEMERKLIELWLKKPQWLRFLHYNTGFVYFPPGTFTEAFATLARELARRIPMVKQLPKDGEKIYGATSRICEEIALGLAAQELLESEHIRTLKVSDGLGDRRILESFYYGCLNGVV